MSTDFSKEINNIAKKVSELSNKKNINEIMKLRSKNDSLIKNTFAKLKKNKTQFESDDIEVNKNMTDEDYEKVSSTISDDETAKIKHSAELEVKINAYKKLAKKINSCIHFLENKKMTIVQCDDNLEVESDSESNDESDEKPKSKKKAIVSSSDSDSDYEPPKKTTKSKKKVVISSSDSDSD
jgi:effector-binding domain-containing protein